MERKRRKKRSANSRRESYCLQQWGKAHFSTSMEPGPFNPRQHSLARYLFSAHQSLSPLFDSPFFVVLCFSSPASLKANSVELCVFANPNRHRNFISHDGKRNFTNQWKSFNFVEDKNHLISVRPFAGRRRFWSQNVSSYSLINFLLVFFTFLIFLFSFTWFILWWWLWVRVLDWVFFGCRNEKSLNRKIQT